MPEMCDNLTKYLEISDFDCIGDVAQHCDLKKLCIATDEALQFDIIPLFCYDFVRDALENWDKVDDGWQKLISGGDYTANGNRRHYYSMGFKRVWVYYSYARYLLINQFNDTANGTVQKQNEFSLPTPLREITDFSNKYRAMGREAFLSVQGYLCRNRKEFPLFDDCKCPPADCGCDGACTCGTTKKLTGVKFKTVGRGF